jgi:hypothetical protein
MNLTVDVRCDLHQEQINLFEYNPIKMNFCAFAFLRFKLFQADNFYAQSIHDNFGATMVQLYGSADGGYRVDSGMAYQSFIGTETNGDV